ncbi:MAG: hypothetical protein WBX15_13500 [Thermoanaerobaculia bacterium]
MRVKLPPAWTLVELFVVANLGFLAIDVYIAHSINAFELSPEWIPVVYSALAPLLLLAALATGGFAPRSGYPIVEPASSRRQLVGRGIGMMVGYAALAVGIGGMLLHLQSHFFEEQSIRSLVYTAPFVAPLAYAGLGLLLILDRMVDSDSLEWLRWVTILAMGGFVGNFVLTLADHAQNGFFNPAEWIGVGAAAFAIAFLAMVVVLPFDRRLLLAASVLMLLESLVGVTGFALHFTANLHRPGSNLWERFLYGAPVFAPLLFPNLALLAAIAIHSLWSRSAKLSVIQEEESLDRRASSSA